jgi:hypothetical protein
VLDEPWFSVPGRHSRAHLLLETPDEFRNRNIFTTPEARVVIRRGRPCVSKSVKLAMARLRQQRYRKLRAGRFIHGALRLDPAGRMDNPPRIAQG